MNKNWPTSICTSVLFWLLLIGNSPAWGFDDGQWQLPAQSNAGLISLSQAGADEWSGWRQVFAGIARMALSQISANKQSRCDFLSWEAVTPQVFQYAQYMPALNRSVIDFVFQNRGQMIGDGECWTLAYDALVSAGARAPGSNGIHPLNFGRPLTADEACLPGDIIQFRSCVFRVEQGTRTETIYVGSPDHTAIIVVPEQNGRMILAQQNTNGNKTVILTSLNFNTMIKGKYQIYRPLPDAQLQCLLNGRQ
ncbi:MAG TPA: hypothetical protein V6D17_00505 [Candidatus Obscuribacterales bacterium]